MIISSSCFPVVLTTHLDYDINKLISSLEYGRQVNKMANEFRNTFY